MPETIEQAGAAFSLVRRAGRPGGERVIMIAHDAALDYLRAGLSLIPIRREDKRPCLPWREFQARRPTRAQVITWWKRCPDAGVAIVCGAISRLAVLDFDPRNGDGLHALAGRLPRTPISETGGGGRHYYFRLAPGERLSKIPDLLPGMDLQAEASCVVAPPSVHPSGRRYRWVPGLALGEVPLAPLPALIRQLIALHRVPQEIERPNGGRRLGGEGLSVEAVLSHLRGVKRCARGWVARCPAHDDREPSLSVADEGGKVLLHCFAGCTFAEIVAALRHETAR